MDKMTQTYKFEITFYWCKITAKAWPFLVYFKKPTVSTPDSYFENTTVSFRHVDFLRTVTMLSPIYIINWIIVEYVEGQDIIMSMNDKQQEREIFSTFIAICRTEGRGKVWNSGGQVVTGPLVSSEFQDITFWGSM